MAEACLFYGEALGRYSFGNDHPFGPDRLPAFWREATRRGLPERLTVEPPATCDADALLAFHTPAYVDLVRSASAAGGGFLDYGDTPAFPGVYEAGATVVGTGLAAMHLLVAGTYRRAFLPIAGLHHARRDRAGGFCVFNDIGVIIAHLRREHGIRRVGYVDIDVHHGDGVFYEFEDDPDVIIGDIHEDGRFLYPGTGFAHETGSGEGDGTKLNVPLLPGAGEDEFFEAFTRVETFLDEAAPAFVILQCGADSLAGDPLAHLEFTPRCHREAATRLRALADRHAGGRLLVMGGGGYNRQNLAAAWSVVVEALI